VNSEKRISGKWWIIHGLWLGGTRGLIESINLRINHPLHIHDADFALLVLECTIGYAVAVACLTAFFMTVLKVGARNFVKQPYAIPTIAIAMIFLIDLLGWISPELRVTHTSPAVSASHPGSSRDLLMITIDTCRADHLPMYGYDQANTPFMQSLAMKSIVFSDAVTCIPVTTSAHVSLMTGRNPPMHGSRFNAVPVDPAVNAARYSCRKRIPDRRVCERISTDQGSERTQPWIHGVRSTPVPATRPSVIFPVDSHPSADPVRSVPTRRTNGRPSDACRHVLVAIDHCGHSQNDAGFYLGSFL
jgi:hypothetical protein